MTTIDLDKIAAEMDAATYRTIRFCSDESSPDHRRVIRTGLTLSEARAYCQDDATRGDGWFDGYEEDA